MTPELIINGRGDVKSFQEGMRIPRVFSDKKDRELDFDGITRWIEAGQELYEGWEIGQKEATWHPHPEYPQLPIAVLLSSDIHYGSLQVDYPLLKHDLDIVENTPNFYVAFNGDEVDFFNAVRFPTGMTENPIPPQLQARTFAKKVETLDRKSKVAVLSHGNHNDFGFEGGQDFYDSFLSGVKAPVFTTGGILNIIHRQHYRMVMNHQYWGKSKINVTNAPKRLLEYEGSGTCDIGWVGHTHQSSYEQFTKGDREYTAVVSGTYKLKDSYAAKKGIGGRGGRPGITMLLYPHVKRIQMFKDIDTAKEYMDALIFLTDHGGQV